MDNTAGPLLQQIRETAAAAATETIATAKAESDAIRARSRDRAQSQRASAVTAHKRTAGSALERTRAETAARVGQDALAARAAVLDRIYIEADRRLETLATHSGLRDLLAATLTDGLAYLPEGAPTVRCAAAIVDTVRGAVESLGRNDITIRVDAAVPMGVLIESADGSIVVDGTFARRAARERPRLSAILAKRLVEKPS